MTENTSKSRQRAAAAGALTTLAIAVWGAYTGTVSWRDQRRTSVEVAASGGVMIRDYQTFASDMAVTIINTSGNPVVLESAALEFGSTITPLYGLDDADSPPESAADGSHYFRIPSSLPPGAAVHLALDGTPLNRPGRAWPTRSG